MITFKLFDLNKENMKVPARGKEQAKRKSPRGGEEKEQKLFSNLKSFISL